MAISTLSNRGVLAESSSRNARRNYWGIFDTGSKSMIV
jgi:hypothetical protein